MNRLYLILFLSILATSNLYSGDAKGFNFIFDNGGSVESLSGYRIPDGDDTDTLIIYGDNTTASYRALVDGGSVLGVPTDISTQDVVYLEVTTSSDTYILGTIDHDYEQQSFKQMQIDTAAFIASIFVLIFILSWHAAKLNR